MLLRFAPLVLFSMVTLASDNSPLATLLIGKWICVEVPSLQIVYRAGHTNSGRNDLGSESGTWRLEGNELIETWTNQFGQNTDRCRIAIRGDKLFLGMHETTTKLHGKQIGEAQQWMTGLTFRRVR
jgi:hypothetical protein